MKTKTYLLETICSVIAVLGFASILLGCWK